MPGMPTRTKKVNEPVIEPELEPEWRQLLRLTAIVSGQGADADIEAPLRFYKSGRAAEGFANVTAEYSFRIVDRALPPAPRVPPPGRSWSPDLPRYCPRWHCVVCHCPLCSRRNDGGSHGRRT